MGRIAAVIPAAGQGKRMGAGLNKQLLLLGARPVLAHTLDVFQSCPLINEVVVVSAADEIPVIEQEVVKQFHLTKVAAVVAGGKERQDSVRLGLAAINPETEWVVVHDGARPLLLLQELEEIIRKALEQGAAIAAVPVKDTIKQVDLEGKVLSTPPRDSLWAVQTPQVFRKASLVRAHQRAWETNFLGTDDASLVEAMGGTVYVVKGSYENIKITSPEDMDIALTILKRRRESPCA